MSISLDLTNDYTRTMYVLLSRISQLSIEVGTGMKHSRGSVLAACWREGFTAKGTKRGALIDCLTLAVAMQPDYEVADIHVKNLHADEKRQQAILRKIYRDAKKWREEGRPGSEQNP